MLYKNEETGEYEMRAAHILREKRKKSKEAKEKKEKRKNLTRVHRHRKKIRQRKYQFNHVTLFQLKYIALFFGMLYDFMGQKLNELTIKEGRKINPLQDDDIYCLLHLSIIGVFNAEDVNKYPFDTRGENKKKVKGTGKLKLYEKHGYVKRSHKEPNHTTYYKIEDDFVKFLNTMEKRLNLNKKITPYTKNIRFKSLSDGIWDDFIEMFNNEVEEKQKYIEKNKFKQNTSL